MGGKGLRRHPTGITIGLFLAACGVLGASPLPAWLKPVDLQSGEALTFVAARVLKKPKMTLADLEREPSVPMPDEHDEPPADGLPAKDVANTGDEAAVVATGDAADDVFRPRTAPGAPYVRKEGPRSALDERTRKLARSIDAMGADVENPCLQRGPDGCAKTALDPFFVGLDALAQREAVQSVRAVVLGNSLIASDHVTDVVRARLVRRFGDGGKGFVLPERLSKTAGRRVRTGNGTDSWIIHTFAAEQPTRAGGYGFTGSIHESSRAGEKTWWKVDGAARMRLFLLDHKGAPGFVVTADGVPIAQEPPTQPGDAAGETDTDVDVDVALDLELPRGTKKVELEAHGAGLLVYGASFDRSEPGVVIDTIGVPAASTALYLSADEGVLRRQLGELDPSLIVVMLGGNEIRSFSYGTLKREKLVVTYGALLDRLKDAAPGASCLAVAPIDAAKATAGGEELVTRSEVQDVVRIQRQVALEKGCAFFDLFTAMGGRGSLAKMKAAGLLSEDLVHPTGRGGDVLGALIADALLDAWQTTSPPKEPVLAAKKPKLPRFAGLSFPQTSSPTSSSTSRAGDPSVLGRFFDRLRALDLGETPRVRIGLLGASDVAHEILPARVRARLGERFGNAGRGLIAVAKDPPAGGADPRTGSTGVSRTLAGPHDVALGRDADFGAAVGVAGTRARLLPGARFEVSFCAGSSTSSSPSSTTGCVDPGRGTVAVSFLRTPDMGTADVLVDGVVAATIGPGARDDTLRGDVGVVSVDVPSAGSKVAVTVALQASGPVHLLEVAAEGARGIVVDGVGLVGATGMTPQRFRQDVWRDAAAVRNWDLVVLSFGGDEAMLGGLDEVSYRHHYAQTLATLQASSPGAPCLLVGPPDRAQLKGDRWLAPPAQELVERVAKDVARQAGCAFFSQTAAMGGPGAVAAWVGLALVAPDRMRFTEAGYQKLGDLLVEDLLAAYAYDSAARAAEVAAGQGAKGPRKADASTSIKQTQQQLAAAGGGSG